jgi:hypothetical protein
MGAFLRKTLGILVMITGILGLTLALAGLIGVWTFKPTVAQGVETTLDTLTSSIDTSQQAMLVTEQALTGTINSVAALQTMLSATASSVQDTGPLLSSITSFLGDQLPSTLGSAAESLRAAQRGAVVLDEAIKSFDTFRGLLGAVPFIGGFIPQQTPQYNPEVPLSDSLGEVATKLDGLPDIFTEMSQNMDKADDNLLTIETSLITMATNVSSITASLEQYRSIVANSQSSMENLKGLLSDVQSNLNNILNITALVLSLFLVWLLVAQVVILTQGYELFQGTAGRMEGPVEVEAASQESPKTVEDPQPVTIVSPLVVESPSEAEAPSETPAETPAEPPE